MIDLQTVTQKKWEKEIRSLIDEGHFFAAYDISVKGLKSYPGNLMLILLGALALVNSGAVDKACSQLDAVKEKLETSDIQAHRIYELLHECIVKSNSNDIKAQDNRDNIQLITELARNIQTIRVDDNRLTEVGTLKVAAEVNLRIWKSTKKTTYLELSKNLSLECFKLDKSPLDGIRAAFLNRISNNTSKAKQLAEAVLEQTGAKDCTLFKADSLQYYLTVGLANLIQGNEQQALQAYTQAIERVQSRHGKIVTARQTLKLLQDNGLQVSQDFYDLLVPPVIVIFGGHPIDPPGSTEPFFPATIEHHVSVSIANKLDEINAEIGYCSAACGSDILFIEAMLDRGAEVNMILPFAEEDFLNARIRYAGSKWERRFKNALKLASTVTWSTNDPYLQDDELFRFNNLLIDGRARLRAEALETLPRLLVVMDYLAPNLAGSAADFMDHWPDITRLHMIDLDTIREESEISFEDQQKTDQISTAPIPSAEKFKSRTIKAMLFADIVGYSKMKEEQLPAIFEFLVAIKEKILANHNQVDLVESWGDALYVAMTGACRMADYAFALCDAMATVDHTAFGLSFQPELRIGLHVGPVYEGEHPLTGRKIVYGQHVSRAARIEPITVPGEIYTSEHFVAVMKAEENAARHAAQSTGEEFVEKYKPEYIGILALPKKFGDQAVYHLRQLKK